MSEVQIVKVDDGGVNARILARQAQADFRRIEAASVKMTARFTSAEGKRLFVRMFNTLQLNTHFISVIARTRLDHDEIAKIEAALRTQIEQASERLNRSIDEAEVLFQAHGITAVATYDALPLELDVHVLSSLSRRYLELLGKLDQLMPLMQTLEIHEVLSSQQLDVQRAALKRQVRNIANGARSQATALRRRMNQLARPEAADAKEASASAAAPVQNAQMADADRDADDVAWLPPEEADAVETSEASEALVGVNDLAGADVPLRQLQGEAAGVACDAGDGLNLDDAAGDAIGSASGPSI